MNLGYSIEISWVALGIILVNECVEYDQPLLINDAYLTGYLQVCLLARVVLRVQRHELGHTPVLLLIARRIEDMREIHLHVGGARGHINVTLVLVTLLLKAVGVRLEEAVSVQGRWVY